MQITDLFFSVCSSAALSLPQHAHCPSTLLETVGDGGALVTRGEYSSWFGVRSVFYNVDASFKLR
jgi:hypothetical protein